MIIKTLKNFLDYTSMPISSELCESEKQIAYDLYKLTLKVAKERGFDDNIKNRQQIIDHVVYLLYHSIINRRDRETEMKRVIKKHDWLNISDAEILQSPLKLSTISDHDRETGAKRDTNHS